MSGPDLRALIADGRKHDAAMTPGAWRSNWSDAATTAVVDVESNRETVAVLDLIDDGDGIAWMRNNLAPLLDALESPACPVHEGELHGGEAEELRAGIESLIAANDLSSSSLQRLLDRVSARDSLAHLERCDAEIDRLRSENAQLIARRDELLALVAKISRETPYPAELDECRSARSALIAEVGTLRSTCAEVSADRALALAELAEVRTALGATDNNEALRAIAQLRSMTRTP